MPSETIAGARVHYIAIPPPEADGAAGRHVALFIHGAGGDHTVWGNQLAWLRGRFRAVAVDLPGHGRSERRFGMSVAANAGVIVALIKRLAIERPVLIGHSMGGAVALQCALDYPAVAVALVVISSGAKLGVAPRVFDLIENDPAAALGEIAAASYAQGAPFALVEEGRAALARCPHEVLLSDFRACDEFDLRERVSQIRLPLLAICGTEDRLTFPKYSEWLVSSVPRARLVLVSGAGHLVMIEKPTEVSRSLSEFLEDLPEARGSPERAE